MLISVIIPFYNVEQYIVRTLSCLYEQTIKNFEVILINDCSTDNSVKYVNGFLIEKPFNQYKLINSTENNGIAFNRNLGLKNSSGDYILYIDSDDIFANDYLEKLYLPMSDSDIDISICPFERIKIFNDGTTEIKNGDPLSLVGKVDGLEALQNLLQDKERSFLWKCMFRRQLFKNIVFPVGCNFLEDAVILPLLYASARSVFYIEDKHALYQYQIRDDSITNGAVQASYFEALDKPLKGTILFLKRKKGLNPTFIARFHFLFTHNVLSNILSSDNIEFDQVKTIYSKFSHLLFKMQFSIFLKNGNLRSLIWMMKLKYFPKSIWQK